MKKGILCLQLLFFSIFSYSQLDSNARSFATTITAFDLRDNLSFIASAGTEGRETGTPGLQRAAEYIASKFGLFGVQQMGGVGTYFQGYKYVRNPMKDVTLFDSINKFEFLKDFYVLPDVKNGLAYNKSLVFMGYGIDDKKFNDYAKDTNLNDKIVLLLNDEPIRKGKYIVSGNKEHSEWNNNITSKINRILKYKPAAIIIIDNRFYEKIDEVKKTIINETTPALLQSIYPINFPVLYTNHNIAAKLLGIDSLKLEALIKRTNKKGKPVHYYSSNLISMEVDRIPTSSISNNVIGYVEGTDLKDEFIVISAHYDHLGMHKGKIYYGADDDGSGTAALIEISQAFTIAKSAGFAPRRSILFCAFSGEEKGLLGSKYYVQNPRVPLEKTVLDLNIDMIGRVDSIYSAMNNPNYIYPIGTNKLSSDLKPLLEKCNNAYSNLILDYKYDDPLDKNHFYTRSDHYNFAKNNVPVIFFFNGTHADYHKPTDTIDKINFSKMETITRLIFLVAWQVANQTEKLKIDIK